MHSLRTVLCIVALLATGAFSSPTPTTQKRSFVHRVRRSPKTDSMAGCRAMHQAYMKFGMDRSALPAMPANAATGTATTGTVMASPEPNDSEYIEQVNIGGQMMTMDFDTGSSDLWVFSTLLDQQTIGQHAAFDPTKSKSFQPMKGATWQIMYGDGSGAAGVVGKDTVNIGGATATSQAVELATGVSQSFQMDTANDGLVGLAFSILNTVQPQQQTTFFDTIMPQLAMPVFSVDLRNDTTGSYEFGAIDNTKFTGQLTTVPVNASSGFWQVPSPTFTVGNKKIANQGGTPAIADTGTSLILVDPAVASAYYAQVNGAVNDPNAGGFTYPCSAQLPNFGVAIGNNYTAMVPGNQITFAQVDANTCFGGVQSNGGAPMQIYGDVMFKTQYVVFQGKNPALMIAPKA